jgi:hypothetical protein
VVGAVALVGVFALVKSSSEPVPMAPDSPPPALAAAPSAASDEQVDLAHPDMVFEADEMLPSLALDVSSEPIGASVWLGGERIGITPMTFDWRHADAAVGRELVLVLKLPGFETKTLKQAITGPALTLSTTLAPVMDSDIQALGVRAAAVQKRAAENAPVLMVKPADLEAPSEEPAEEESSADEPEADQPEGIEEPEPAAEAPKAGAVEPNPYASQPGE